MLSYPNFTSKITHILSFEFQPKSQAWYPPNLHLFGFTFVGDQQAPFVFSFYLLLACILIFLILFKIQKYVLSPFSYCTRRGLAIKGSSLVSKLGF